ncbi:hypothetical protein C8Q74DRAFT_1287071 [Fomes fomentarius]|nr:hypothetical protein C8Q74DRAFT_1287071 [Fomes fomentarius]
MSEIVIREVAHNVWTFSRPFTLFGLLPVGGRSTAIKLEAGGVWILASTPLTDETRQKLAELGEVKYIIAGNSFHNLFLRPYKEAYPGAKLIGPEGLLKKKELDGLQLEGVYSASNPDAKHGFEDEIEACYFSGYANKDTAFFHKASKTVVAADLLFNIPAREQFSKSKESARSLLFNAMHPRGWQQRAFVWSKEENKEALRREAQTVYSWDFDRYIPCHGDVIETGAKAAWASAFARYLK